MFNTESLEPYLMLVILVVALHSFIGRALTVANPGAIRVVCYFFSLSVCATPVVILAAIARKQIGEDGAAKGDLGHFIRDWLLPFFFDVGSDFIFLSVAVALVIVPQLVSFLLCASFGCAHAPIFISRSIDVLFWGLAKACCVASGILFSFTLFCSIRGWPIIPEFIPRIKIYRTPVTDLTTYITLSAALLLYAFLFLWLRFCFNLRYLRYVNDCLRVLRDLRDLRDLPISIRVLIRCHRFLSPPVALIVAFGQGFHEVATRHNPPPTPEDEVTPEELERLRLLYEAALLARAMQRN
ncbi:hypothetical protein [Paraburkholderia aromaticivorans]|uniref:hypothetical protein n=1 Tax=Paraburkholderia aromaticivorans TaxID=2026199 RepID=UPI001455DF11|nr:hypothetical protein [Paraburkholderia aromaticivorans]